MLSISSSVSGSTPSTGKRVPTSQQTTCGPHRAVATVVDGGRPRAPEAVKAAGRESGSGRPDDGHGAGPTHANAGGLVICAKVSAPRSGLTLTALQLREERLRERLHPRDRRRPEDGEPASRHRRHQRSSRNGRSAGGAVQHPSSPVLRLYR
jgi:hypothetical protein